MESCQLPLPKHIDEDKVIDAIDPKKDVDGFSPQSVGAMVIGKPGFLPVYSCWYHSAFKEKQYRY